MTSVSLPVVQPHVTDVISSGSLVIACSFLNNRSGISMSLNGREDKPRKLRQRRRSSSTDGCRISPAFVSRGKIMRTTPVTQTIASAAGKLLPVAALALLVELLILGGERSPARASHGSTLGQADFVFIDMNTIGNTATSLGAGGRQECVSVPTVGSSLDIDITVDEVDPADPMGGLQTEKGGK